MSISSDSIKELLLIPKLIVINDKPQSSFYFQFGSGLIDERYKMCSMDQKWQFLLHVYQKKHQKEAISFHFQKNMGSHVVHLLRIDYVGGHRNPEKVPENAPDFLRPYAGKIIDENHAHIYVEGELELKWAIPLMEYDFSIKQISNVEDFCAALDTFCQKINLQTQYSIGRRLFL